MCDKEGSDAWKVACRVARHTQPSQTTLEKRLRHSSHTTSQTFHLTDYNRPLERDEDLAEQAAGAVLCVAHGPPGELSVPGQETVSFQPHPKTLTMAGDYEYFAAQARRRRRVCSLL